MKLKFPETMRLTLDMAAQEALQEALSASLEHKPFTSTHEGWAVIWEELDELWDEVRERNPTKVNMRKEAVQVAAMALRFIMDLT